MSEHLKYSSCQSLSQTLSGILPLGIQISEKGNSVPLLQIHRLYQMYQMYQIFTCLANMHLSKILILVLDSFGIICNFKLIEEYFK